MTADTTSTQNCQNLEIIQIPNKHKWTNVDIFLQGTASPKKGVGYRLQNNVGESQNSTLREQKNKQKQKTAHTLEFPLGTILEILTNLRTARRSAAVWAQRGDNFGAVIVHYLDCADDFPDMYIE